MGLVDVVKRRYRVCRVLAGLVAVARKARARSTDRDALLSVVCPHVYFVDSVVDAPASCRHVALSF